jgi:hypothetical protein
VLWGFGERRELSEKRKLNEKRELNKRRVHQGEGKARGLKIPFHVI